MPSHLLSHSRREFLTQVTALSGLGAASLLLPSALAAPTTLVAEPPKGFTPLRLPGKVAKATARGDFPSIMHKNQIWPKLEIAKQLFEKAMTDLTGAADATAAMKRFVGPEDVVAIKPNGIAGGSMATSYELIIAVIEAVMAAGVPAQQIILFEQHAGYVLATRSGAKNFPLPVGVKVTSHGNKDCVGPGVKIYQGITTKFCRPLIQATAVINMGLVKDHSICGYTGALKNITHGCIDNPEAHHGNYANPQIAMLYAHPIVTSRVRLHVTDGFRLMYHGGPLAKELSHVVPHGSVYVSTDPVALDTIGWNAVEAERKAHKQPSLTRAGRPPKYLESAHDLGLGVHDLNQIRLVEATV